MEDGFLRQRLGWIEGVTMALGSSGMTVEAARQIGRSGSPDAYVDDLV